MTALCTLVADWNGTLPANGAICEVKVDGWRAMFFTGIDGTARLWSRNGRPLPGAEHIRQACLRMESVAGERMFFDGEIQVERARWVGGKVVMRGSLLATKTWFERGWKYDDRVSQGRLHLFDCMTLAEWQAGGSPIPLCERKRRLAELWQAADIDPTVCMPVEYATMHDPIAVVELARRVWAAGGEGLCIKDPNAPYQRSRTSAWQKIKIDNMGKWAHRFPHLERMAA